MNDRSDLAHLKAEFLRAASHELQAPIVPLRGYVDLIADLVARPSGERPADYDARIATYLRKLRRQVARLTRLVDDLGDLARLETGRFALDVREIDLRDVAIEAVEQARFIDDTIPFRLDAPATAVPVRGDADRLVQVATNLLLNAQRHGRPTPMIDVRIVVEGDEARLEVRDGGRGMSPEQVRALFAGAAAAPPAAAMGLGIGLLICRAIIEQHHGAIEVDSAPGQGSTFRVRLPLAT